MTPPDWFLVFDLDDTLYPEREFVRGGFVAVDRWLHERFGYIGFGERAWSRFLQGQRKMIFDDVLRSFGWLDTEKMVQQLVQIYREHRPQIQLFAEAPQILDSLYGRHLLGLLTDGYLVTQQNKVVALELHRWFAHILCTEALGRAYWKPSPVPYEKLAAQANRRPQQCVYVGDNPNKDFVTARLLGWRTVRVRREGTEHFAATLDKAYEAEVEIGSLAEVQECISKF